MQNNAYLLLFVLLVAGFLSSCANYKLNYAAADKNWDQQLPDTTLKRTHTIYLVGDAGYLPHTGVNPVLTYLQSHLPGADASTTVLFLGDNIYPKGMPEPSSGEKREAAERSIRAQMDAVADFKGKVIFIAGNHDWASGLAGRRRQEQYVEEYLNSKKGMQDEEEKGWNNYFLPDEGCPGPEVVEVDDQLVLILIDSQWWLADWDRQPGIHEGCEIKSRGHFVFEIENVLRKYRHKNVVVALHHPPYTNGSHGGKFHIKQHFFPLTDLDPKLYIPLPVLGSLAAGLRAYVGSRQDMANGEYKALMHALLKGAKKNGRYIFVSGHEHALQYLENDDQAFVVSGSGSKVSPVSLGKGARFAYGAPGYSTLEFYENGEAWARFWTPDAGGKSTREVYRVKIKAPADDPETPVKTGNFEFIQIPDSVEKPVIKDRIKPVGALHKLVLGDHYRDVYMGSYRFPALDLATCRGGLKPTKQGGGNQTNSLRLEDAEGREYVLRDLTKDVSRLLPFPLNKMTAARGIVIDNFLSTHPFAPLAIPVLAEAIQVYHGNPQICYVPKQPALGDFNANFGGSVYLFEERPAGNWNGSGVFGNSEKIVSTQDLLEKMQKNNNHKIDQRWALRSRLFDLLIGDWDRHDDQWRWARFEDAKRRYYRPVPRDRDQAFSRYDGLVVFLARQTMPFLRQMRVYGPEIASMKWSTWSARFFDPSFLNEMDWPDWESEALFIRQNLTDSIIDAAFATWPRQAQDLSASPIKSALRQRRDDMVDIARRRYLLLAKEVDVYGSDERELFEIDRETYKQVRVRVFELSKKGEKKEKLYERVFDSKITRMLNIYGLGGDDEFRVRGSVNHSIPVRLIGGQGRDVFSDSSTVVSASKSTFVFDDKGDNVVQRGTQTRDARTKRRIYNIYDHRAAHYEYDYLVPLPLLGQNPDDGFFVGFNITHTSYKFKKDPFHAQHNVAGRFAFATRAWFIRYEGDYLNAFGKWDFLLESQFSGPSYAFNYFGFGNDAKADFEQYDIDFYRVRQSMLRFFPALKKRFAGESGQFFFGPWLEMRKLEATPGRYIVGENAGIDPADFERQFFGGARIGLRFNSLDNWLAPRKGVVFNTTLGYLNDFTNNRYRFAALSSELAYYRPLVRDEGLILVIRSGVQHNIGNNFAFYHGANLGGRETLRGYRGERFYGKTAFWQNFDLRARLLSSYNRILPLTLGVFCGFDHGRVWVDDDSSENWKYDYGGGLWIAPLDGLTFYVGVFQPKENDEDGPRFFFRLGAGF